MINLVYLTFFVLSNYRRNFRIWKRNVINVFVAFER